MSPRIIGGDSIEDPLLIDENGKILPWPRIIFRGPPSAIKQHMRGPQPHSQCVPTVLSAALPKPQPAAVAAPAPRAALQPLLLGNEVSAPVAAASPAAHLSTASISPRAGPPLAVHVGRTFDYFIQGLGEDEPFSDNAAEMDRIRLGMQAYAAREERCLVNMHRREAKMKQVHMRQAATEARFAEKIRALEARLKPVSEAPTL
ncbi:hypothetical protein DFH09DRAFT_1306510 [Mycena vulgaris]|nr:hypothetical protein DFH09DRAFT_1306510 [Mycena vulgaris]